MSYPEIVGEDFKNNWIEGMSEDEYHADKTAISSTTLRTSLESLKMFHYYHVQDHEKKAETKAMRLGKIVHMAMLEPDRFRSSFVIQPDFGDFRSAVNRAKRDLWLGDLRPGVLVVTQEELDKLRYMVDAVMGHEDAVNLIKGASFEQIGYFRDPVTSIKCRFKPDIIRKNSLVLPDLKTSRNSSFGFFSKEIWSRQYFIQMAFYAYGVEMIHGRKPDMPCFIVVENEPPYDVCVHICDDAMMERGTMAVRKGLDRIAECLKEDRWPGKQPDGAQTISLPIFTDNLEI